MNVSDLRYINPASISGEMQTREILGNIGTPEPVIDWVLTLVRDAREEARAYEEEFQDQIHLDMV